MARPFALLGPLAQIGRDPILAIAMDGRLIDVNEAAVVKYGWSREELLGLHITDLRAPETRGDVTRLMTAASDHGVLFETRHVRKDGSSFPCEVSSAGGDFAGARVLFSVIRDLTERRRTLEALRQSEDRFARIFRASPVATSISTLGEGRYLDVNEAFLRASGYTRAEVIGKTSVELALWADDATRLWVADRLRALAPVRDVEIRYRAKSGKVIETITSIEPLDLGGERCLLALSHDISDYKRLEADLHQAQKMDAIGRVAGGVAHDFNNVLTTIVGHAEILSSSLPQGSSERASAEQIEHAAATASALTLQLLAFTRKQLLQPEVLDVGDEVVRTGGLLRRLIGEHIDLIVKPPVSPLRVRIDRGQLAQVLLNLTVNARDAMHGGGRVELRVTDGDEGSRGEVWIEVRDNGSGIDPATRARLFEPFFTTKPPGQGTGLGLSTVADIVRGAGGRIDVESALGQGTLFRVRLPRSDEVARPAPVARSASSGSETILLVEDDASVREFVALVLRKRGYQVLAPETAEGAVRLGTAHAGSIDLLITDLVMPEMSGTEVASALGRARPTMRVLFISGYPGETVIQEGMLAAGSAFLRKPFAASVLAERVRSTLDQP